MAPPPADRSSLPTRKRHLREPDDGSYVRGLTAAARVEMVWELTRQAWAFTRSRMSPDFVEMLSALRDAGAEYLIGREA